MKYEYEAVSGDQSLFDLTGANFDDNVVVKIKGIRSIASRKGEFDQELIIAERKVTEKYIPKAGDVFRIDGKNIEHGECLCLKSNFFGVAFEYLDDEIGHFDSISTSGRFKFIRKHDDKAANPVNFTSEKYVPRVGDVFAVKNKHGINPFIFTCTKVTQVVSARGHYSEVFADGLNGGSGHCNSLDNDFHLIMINSTK